MHEKTRAMNILEPIKMAANVSLWLGSLPLKAGREIVSQSIDFGKGLMEDTSETHQAESDLRPSPKPKLGEGPITSPSGRFSRQRAEQPSLRLIKNEHLAQSHD